MHTRMTDNPPELAIAEAVVTALPKSSLTAQDQEHQPPPDSQSVEDKLNSLQQISLSLSLPQLDIEQNNLPQTTSIHADAASTVFYYPAPDMSAMHPMMHPLATLPYLPPSAYQHQFQLQPHYQLTHSPPQPHHHIHIQHHNHSPPHSSHSISLPNSSSSNHSTPRSHHRKSNSLTQSHHGPVDPTQMRVPRVYVGNLAFSVGWQDLKDFFRNALGSVGRVDLIAHPSGRSKGCAVVEFDSIEDAARAINELNNAEIHGRKIFIREDREGKGFGAQSAQRAAAAAAQASAMAAAVGAGDSTGVAGAVAGGAGMYGGVLGMMGPAAGDVYGGMYSGAGAPGYHLSMQLYAQYLQQLQQQHQIRQHQEQQQQQQQQMDPYLQSISPMAQQPLQQAPSSPLPLPMQPLPMGFAQPTMPLPFTPTQPFLQPPHNIAASYTLNRPFSFAPLSPSSLSTNLPPSADSSPPPYVSSTTTTATSSTASSTVSSPHPSQQSTQPLQQSVQPLDPNSPRLLLSNLPFSFSRSQLWELASSYSGVPLRCDIVLDSASGRSRGVGVAVYSSREECERVLDEMRGLVVGERKIHVRKDEHLG